MLQAPADSRLHHWLQQLLVNGPVLASVLLGALITIDLGNTALSVHAATRAARSVPPAGSAQNTALDAQRIAAAHLFGSAGLAPASAEAALSGADLQLKGTIAGAAADHGFAIIAGGNISRLYRVGDRVGDATLAAVFTDYVILDRDGTPEQLRLPHKLLPGQLLAARAAAGAGKQVFVDNLGRTVDKDPGVLDKIMRMVDTYEEKGGTLRGFRVYPLASGVALRKLGLSAGDLVTSINGAQFTDLQHGREALSAVGAQGSAAATIDRDGRTLSVTLNIAEAAEQIRSEAGAGGAAASQDADGGTT